MSNTDSFGYWLRRRRLALDKTQSELAKLVPCSLAMIKKIEIDARRPSPQMAERLAVCLGLTPSEQIVFLTVARGDRPVSVLDLVDIPINQPAAADHIPTILTPLIGRQTELATVLALLTNDDVRLLTILGPGGMGKTRLAIAVAEAYREGHPHDFSDGIVFVDLSTTPTPNLIVSTLAYRLGLDLAERPKRDLSPRQKLLDFLGPRQMLLLLDNYEHLLAGDSAAVLTDLLSAAPNLKLLITSRLRINLREEHLYALSGLLQAVDANWSEQAGPDQADPEEHAASQLFLVAARRVRPDFRLARGEAQVLTTICQILAGIPLALELAAAWVDSLSLMGIAAELEKGIDILSSDLNNLPERHRSMRGTFDATWRLLEQAERDSFMQLSIFSGGFDKEAATDVAGASLMILSRLIGKSLIEFHPKSERYRIHEVLRQYGEERLTESGSLVKTQRRHFAHFADLAATAYSNLFGAEQINWLERLEREQDNLRTALTWGLNHPERVSDTATLVIGLSWFWRIRSYVMEGRDWVSAMLRQPGLDTHERAWLLYHAGHFAWMQDDFELARLRQEQSLNLWSELGEAGKRGAAYASATYGMALYGGELHAPDDLTLALSRFETALALFLEVGDDWGEAFSLQWLAFSLTAQGKYQEAMAATRESLAIFERLGEAWGRGMVTGALANLSLHAGELGQARHYAESALEWRSSVGHRHSVGVGHELLATIAEHEQNMVAAAASYRQAIAIFDNLGNKPYADKLRQRLAQVLIAAA